MKVTFHAGINFGSASGFGTCGVNVCNICWTAATAAWQARVRGEEGSTRCWWLFAWWLMSSAETTHLVAWSEMGGGRNVAERESSLLTTYWSGSTDVFGVPASRHGSLNPLFQVALYPWQGGVVRPECNDHTSCRRMTPHACLERGRG